MSGATDGDTESDATATGGVGIRSSRIRWDLSATAAEQALEKSHSAAGSRRERHRLSTDSDAPAESCAAAFLPASVDTLQTSDSGI